MDFDLDSAMENLAVAATHAAKRGHTDIAELIETVMGDISAKPGCITKVYKGGYGHDACYAGQINVEHIVMENEGFEDSAWVYIRTICEDGCYDDSDWGSEVFCWYFPTDGVTRVLDEARIWYEGNPTVVAEYDLEHPDTWSVKD
jgi:hypothetical protein